MIRLNTFDKFKILHILNHIISFLGIYFLFKDFSYSYLLIGLLSYLWLGIIGVNVSLHRFYAHRAFTTTKLKEKILLWSSVFTSLGSPAMWCSVHRLHHSHSDTLQDPHNPHKIGILKTWFTIWPKLHIPKPLLKPFLKTREQVFIHDNYFLLNFSLLFFLCCIDIKLAAFLYAIPAIGCFHGASAIGVIPHYWGYRTYETKDKSHNNWLASILSLGEGWHNNHHANPSRWYQGEKWWEIDPPSFMIKKIFMKK